MRKMIWCASALSVAAALGVYCASDYAARNPDSLFGKAFVRAATFSPLAGAMGLSCSTDCGDCCSQGTNAAFVKTTNDDPFDPSEAAEPLEPIRVEITPFCPVFPESYPPTPQTEEPMVSEWGTVWQQRDQQPPATMPYAPEDMARHHEALEESQDEGLALPTGNYLKHFPQFIPQTPPFPLSREQAELEAATAKQLAGEESEPALPGQNLIPIMKENPANHHHHGESCPYFSHPHLYQRTPTPALPIEQPKVEPAKEKKPESTVLEHRSLRVNLNDARPMPTQVDTMDYRPRDDGQALPNGRDPF